MSHKEYLCDLEGKNEWVSFFQSVIELLAACIITIHSDNYGYLPANPINSPSPKQAKNAKNTITNSRLCIE
jgi:hypothetical protein